MSTKSWLRFCDLGSQSAVYIAAALLIGFAGVTTLADNPAAPDRRSTSGDAAAGDMGLQVATFGGGCFWCTEAIFQRVKGVERVVSGFMGGNVPNPSYEMVMTKKTGHAEVVHIVYDPDQVKYEKLLEIFWKTHDPTSRNRQGFDVGPQYRSVVFYHNDQQRELAVRYKQLLDESEAFSKKIVTEISPASQFYPAEAYHQNYYNSNKLSNPYCKQIQYKLAKFRKVFPDDLNVDRDRVK